MDCEQLTPNARKIFKKIKMFFPPDPWNRPQWIEDGKVYDNGWFDLKKSADRERLKKQKQSLLGYFIETQASGYREKNGSLKGFTRQCFSQPIQTHVEILLLLNDLNFQIETMDLMEE